MADEGALSQVTGNVVIIDRILKFSNFDNLKSLRQVSSFWNNIVSPKLFQKSVVNLIAGRKSIEALQYFANHTENMKQGIQEIKIISNAIFCGELRKEESQIWNDILENISNDVEKLFLGPNHLKTEYFIPRNNIKFPNVSQLELANCELDIVQMYPEIYNNIPNLKELIVSHLADNGFILLPLVKIEDGSRLWSLAQNLNSFTINRPLRSLQLLVDFPQKWKKLDLSLPSDLIDGSQIVEKLEQLLEQNKCSLICLKLRNYSSKYSYTNDQKPELRLPNFG